MSLYRKKPVVIKAWPANEVWYAATRNWSLLPSEIAAAYEKGGWVFLGNGDISVPTLEGPVMASKNDMIIQGVNGEFYPCKPDIFDKTYEDVE